MLKYIYFDNLLKIMFSNCLDICGISKTLEKGFGISEIGM